MQWIIKHFAWFFFKLMNVSGAEAVVAAASPWIGQGESACLVRPYVDLMTESELHLTMTSGMYLPYFGVPFIVLVQRPMVSNVRFYVLGAGLSAVKVSLRSLVP